ncbi:imidazole glycerol phosphate synthase subunit HisH [Chitinimonas sp. BJB300]|uniref:imidazole glycerol phosphate synthase subunit HisH n=1 Tax=Chitinimonas sp. BJB300 TaxID=1559339 RepID=UPI000C0F3F98|nr:imidazole glycerol phosphate synthase subunit HisH [Chitinimonas sp. BJB300]PHV10293.1 imidazole glycerol phosphate synthase subunit HisH [Chitinimonas sp. BJB300]TSJ91542.1 imidazole glycerol phosphate synthase subunit HisH [Chitinimonas sp. BJB300]
MKIAVIDYGMGNLRSVTHALEHVAPHEEIILTRDPAVIAAADKVVFPGQGAMRDCMRELTERDLRDVVLDAAKHKPFLGICVGAQLLFEMSEEGGDTPALSVFPGRVVRFPAERMVHDAERLKVPHMGWNEVRQTRSHPLWQGILPGERFYFVHSYYMQTPHVTLTVGESVYPFAFTVAVARANIFATQFHPEKSHAAGLKLLANFVAWNGVA